MTLARSVRVGCTNVRFDPDTSPGTLRLPFRTERASERDTEEIISMEVEERSKLKALVIYIHAQSHD